MKNWEYLYLPSSYSALSFISIVWNQRKMYIVKTLISMDKTITNQQGGETANIILSLSMLKVRLYSDESRSDIYHKIIVVHRERWQNNNLTAKDPEHRVAHIPPMVAPGPAKCQIK